jgi:hypothetical protein
MREYRSYGSVRGAPGNRRLYRDRRETKNDTGTEHCCNDANMRGRNRHKSLHETGYLIPRLNAVWPNRLNRSKFHSRSQLTSSNSN